MVSRGLCRNLLPRVFNPLSWWRWICCPQRTRRCEPQRKVGPRRLRRLGDGKDRSEWLKRKKSVESASPASDKKKALETAMAQIERAYGKGSIMRLGENAGVVVDAIPTGSLSLDIALGIGGVPKGRIIEIYGPESSGKTTLALHIVAEAQKRGARWPSSTRSTPGPSYARALGVDIDSMLISQPDTGEQGLEICEALVRSGAIDVVVVDSVAALVPRAEIEGTWGQPCRPAGPADEPGPAEAGRLHRQDQLHRHLHQPAAGKGRGHVRQSGGDHRRPGAEVLRLGAHRRAPGGGTEERRRGHRQPHPGQDREEQGVPPFREAEFDIMYGEGISKWGELVDLAVKLDILQKSGSWFSMGETRLGQGRDAVKEYLKNNPELADRIEAEVRANSFKLMSKQSQIAARAAGRAVDVSADDFEDGADGQ